MDYSSSSNYTYYFNSYNSTTFDHQYHQFPSQYHQDNKAISKNPSHPPKMPAKNNNNHHYNNNKKPIAPLPPNPPRIYQVEPRNFKEVVQMLTCAPELEPTWRLQEAAPPPLSLTPPHQEFNSVGSFVEEKMAPCKPFDTANSAAGALSPSIFGFNLSPSSLAWCSSFLMSPGTPRAAVI